jgi:hypothetical protein
MGIYSFYLEAGKRERHYKIPDHLFERKIFEFILVFLKDTHFSIFERIPSSKSGTK